MKKEQLKIIFAGTPEFAAVALRSILQSQHQVIAVYTQPDKPFGRGQKIVFSAVKQVAQQFQIPVFQPAHLKNDMENIKNLNADVMVVAAYGVILPEYILTLPPYGCINIHASLLPRWRGAAPIQRAILAGDKETGISIMQMEKGLDTGPVLLKVACPIEMNDTSETLHDRLANMGANAIIDALNQLSILEGEPQTDAFATYAKKIEKSEAKINWQETAELIVRKIRAFNPWPVASTQFSSGTVSQGNSSAPADQTLRIWSAEYIDQDAKKTPGTIEAIHHDKIIVATGKQLLAITRLQLAGGKQLSVKEFLNSPREWLQAGARFQ